MLLFYSNHCASSKMLVDSVKRYNGTDYLKLVNIDTYLAKGIAIPAKIHSVPAIILPNKTILFGKQVFDYLLLPGKGFLFNLPNKEKKQTILEASPLEPLSFNFSKNSSSDMFSFIDETNEDVKDPHKAYNWCNITENITIPTVNNEETVNMETRSKKNLPDVTAIKSERDLDLQNYLTVAS